MPRIDYTEAEYDWFDPTRSETFLNDMTRSLNAIRDRHMSSTIVQQVKEGKRVFAVVGFTHAVMQEVVLRAELANPADSQPGNLN